jgi:hypothetical protein
MGVNSRMFVALALTGLLLAATVHAGSEERHSGRIVAVEPKTGAITLEEMGPWTGPGQGLIKRSVELTAQTDIALLTRSNEAEAGEWPGAFKESPLSAMELRPGDYVTVSVEDRGGRLFARSVAVVRSSQAGPTKQPTKAIQPPARTGTPEPYRTRTRGY